MFWAYPCASYAQDDSWATENSPLIAELMNDNPAFNLSFPDSIKLRELEIEIEQTQLQVSETNLLHRLFPQIHLSASLGFKDVLFLDPSSQALSVLPKDQYRLSITLSVSDLLDGSKHTRAELRLELLRNNYARMCQHRENVRAKLQRELSGLRELKTLISDQLAIHEEVLRFNDLRFRQGKIEYDVRMRSQLDVANVKKTIFLLDQRIEDVCFQLAGR